MVRSLRLLGGALAIVLVATFRTGTAAPAALEQAQRTIWDGVYTQSQAARGGRVFDGVCSRCHSRTEWGHESFLRGWSGKSVEDLFSEIYETMPPRAPLPDHEYAEVIAYMLSINNVPAGDVELGTDPGELSSILITTAPSD